METLESLEAKGDLLFGPVVPKWFDGDCSVPGRIGRALLNAKLAKEACVLHDFSYMLIPILYEYQSPLWNLKLHVADAELRWNLTKMRKRHWFAKAWGYVYYVGVRMPYLGGRRAANRNPELDPRRPKNGGQLLELIECTRRFNGGDLTVKSRRVFKHFGSRLDVDLRKELR